LSEKLFGNVIEMLKSNSEFFQIFESLEQ